MDMNKGGDVGFICGGQLAAMGAEAAMESGLTPVIFGTSEIESAAQVVKGKAGIFIASSDGKTMAEMYSDRAKLDEFIAAAKSGAPIAFDWENAPAESLEYLEGKGLIMKPSIDILRTTQNRGREKAKINDIHGSTVTAEYEEVSTFEEAKKAFDKLGAGRLKTCEGGYDGKGQWVINNMQDLESAFKEMGDNVPELVYEKNVAFEKEASIIVGRNQMGQMVAYDVFENVHRGGILRTTNVGNTNIDQGVEAAMVKFTQKTAEAMGLEGIMAMELFLMPDGTFKANEIAARAHNSGHITGATHDISQFELQIAAIMNEDLVKPKLQRPGQMINVIGNDTDKYKNTDWSTWGHTTNTGSGPVMDITSYGKGEAKTGRKMGHVNIT